MFSDLTSVADCTDAVSTWFMENALLLNPGKTEAVIFGTRQRLAGLDITGGVNIAGSTVQFNDALKLLGVTLDASLSFDKHVTGVLAYLHEDIHDYQPTRMLRSSTAHLLQLPLVLTSVASRAFTVTAPIVWNSL